MRLLLAGEGELVAAGAGLGADVAEGVVAVGVGHGARAVGEAGGGADTVRQVVLLGGAVRPRDQVQTWLVSPCFCARLLS